MKTLYIVPCSRLALYGFGQREECLSRGGHALSAVLDLLKGHPEFRFLVEGLAPVDAYLTCHPEQRETFVRIVWEGGIEMGAQWTALPQHLPEGEALVRNLLFGQRYLERAFGVRSGTVPMTDGAGWTSQFPQVARQCGVERKVWTQRVTRGADFL